LKYLDLGNYPIIDVLQVQIALYNNVEGLGHHDNPELALGIRLLYVTLRYASNLLPLDKS
jgi:hypothetical protein